MSNLQDGMILDQEEYNEAYKDLDLEEKVKSFYSHDSKSEEGFQKLKSSKTIFLGNKKKKNSINTNIKEKKFSNTQINRIEKRNLTNKNINRNTYLIKLVEKSESKESIEDPKEESNNKNNKESKDIDNNEKTEINFNNYNHENLLIDNNIMEIENEKDGDLFEKENVELIKKMNDNLGLEENPSEQSSLKNAKSTIILFIGCS